MSSLNDHEHHQGKASEFDAQSEPGALPTFRHYLPDLVYGANDGIITTFVVISGVTGADLSLQIILILGLANLLADGFSMGASNYLSKRSQTEKGEQMTRREGLEHGLSTTLAFVLAGSVPLAAYLVPIPSIHRFPLAVALTLVALFGLGSTRALVTSRSWWRSGAEMLLVGAIAAVVAYAIGALVVLVTNGPMAT